MVRRMPSAALLWAYRGIGGMIAVWGVVGVIDTVRTWDDWFSSFFAVCVTGLIGLGVLNLVASGYSVRVAGLLSATAAANLALCVFVVLPRPTEGIWSIVLLTAATALLFLNDWARRREPHHMPERLSPALLAADRRVIGPTPYCISAALLITLSVLLGALWGLESIRSGDSVLLFALAITGVLNVGNALYGYASSAVRLTVASLDVLSLVFWELLVETSFRWREVAILIVLSVVTGYAIAWIVSDRVRRPSSPRPPFDARAGKGPPWQHVLPGDTRRSPWRATA